MNLKDVKSSASLTPLCRISIKRLSIPPVCEVNSFEETPEYRTGDRAGWERVLAPSKGDCARREFRCKQSTTCFACCCCVWVVNKRVCSAAIVSLIFLDQIGGRVDRGVLERNERIMGEFEPISKRGFPREKTGRLDCLTRKIVI